MAFVKLDTKILNSTTWMDPDACKVFITALLLAEPFEVREPMQTINVYDTNPAEFVVPVGWYGFVPAAGPAIVHQAMIEDEAGMAALQRLANPDPGSRTPAHEGRRLVRIAGGFIVLNYIAHRDRDHSVAERQARFRARQKERNAVTVTTVTHADSDVDVDSNQSKALRKSASKAKGKEPESQLEASIAHAHYVYGIDNNAEARDKAIAEARAKHAPVTA